MLIPINDIFWVAEDVDGVCTRYVYKDYKVFQDVALSCLFVCLLQDASGHSNVPQLKSATANLLIE